jgi:hypothetical protein
MKTEPTEALRLIEYSWYALPNATAIDRKDCIEAVNIAFKEGQSSPKIKQLEWDDYDGVYFDSISAVGHYIVFDGGKFSEASYRFALSYNGNLVDYFESLDEAKAAAQADFERRIMECLD